MVDDNVSGDVHHEYDRQEAEYLESVAVTEITDDNECYTADQQ